MICRRPQLCLFIGIQNNLPSFFANPKTELCKTIATLSQIKHCIVTSSKFRKTYFYTTLSPQSNISVSFDEKYFVDTIVALRPPVFVRRLWINFYENNLTTCASCKLLHEVMDNLDAVVCMRVTRCALFIFMKYDIK